jgi:hypothetical protein
MPPKHELTPTFLKLTKKMKERRSGDWVSTSKTMSNKYSDLVVDQITRLNKEGDLSEYEAKAGDKFLIIKTFVNYVSMSIGETEYEADSYIDVVGALNVDGQIITISEIIYYMNWDFSSENYLDFG